MRSCSFIFGNGLQYNAKLIHTIGITRNQRRADLEFQLFQGGVLTHRPRHFDRLDHQGDQLDGLKDAPRP